MLQVDLKKSDIKAGKYIFNLGSKQNKTLIKKKIKVSNSDINKDNIKISSNGDNVHENKSKNEGWIVNLCCLGLAAFGAMLIIAVLTIL